MWIRILYLAYLISWKRTHKGKAFKGCTPACFEEWQDCELKEMCRHPEWYNGSHFITYVLDKERERRSRNP